MHAGRLKYFLPAWRHITSNEVILSWVQGIKIAFATHPYQSIPPPIHKFSPTDVEFLITEINNLKNIGAINECYDKQPGQFLSSFFLADKPNGKKNDSY